MQIRLVIPRPGTATSTRRWDGRPESTDGNIAGTSFLTIGIALDAVLGNDWLGPAYVYSLRDAGSNTADTEQNFGLVRTDWTPKIAYGRVDAYAAEHSGR
ncbi:MAG: hypothetical protein ACOH2Q_04810 [Rhodococcus sp. (in: high G+C Gram-positive bacteria)]